MRRSIALQLAGFAILAIVVRFIYASHGWLAYDEYQHMHAAHLTSLGQTPYADFFAHHSPLFYYLAAALIPMSTPGFDTLIHARYLSLLFHFVTIAVGALWTRSIAGRPAALLTTALLAGNFCLFAWGTRTYLDTYAAPLLLLSAWALSSRSKRSLRYFLSGAALSFAVLFTQKAVMVTLAPAIVFLSRAPRELTTSRESRGWAVDLTTFVAGALAPALLLPPLLGADGIRGLVSDAIVLNLYWKARHFPWRELQVLLASEGFIYLTALVGLAVGLWGLVRRRVVIEDRDIPNLYLASLGVGIFTIPVVWEEYFILLIPFAVIVAGITLVRWWNRYFAADANGGGEARRVRTRGFLISSAWAGASLVDLIGLRFLPNNPLSLTAFVTVLALWGGLAFLIVDARRRRRRWEVSLWVTLILVLPVVQQVDWVPRHPNDADRARVEYVMAATKPNDPIFDGRSGFGVFRPHAYWYWFLHDEMQLMLSEEQKGPQIVKALERQRVKIAIVDDFTKLLPESVLQYITAHYADTAFPDIKWRADEPRVVEHRGSSER